MLLQHRRQPWYGGFLLRYRDDPLAFASGTTAISIQMCRAAAAVADRRPHGIFWGAPAAAAAAIVAAVAAAHTQRAALGVRPAATALIGR
jgi:hypothetical protein